MADHYKSSSSHSGDGVHRFFPDPLGSCRLKYDNRLGQEEGSVILKERDNLVHAEDLLD